MLDLEGSLHLVLYCVCPGVFVSNGNFLRILDLEGSLHLVLYCVCLGVFVSNGNLSM